MARTIPKEVLDAAHTLARENAEIEPNIVSIYLCPAEDRVLLVEVDPSSIPNDEGVRPIYFRASPTDGLPFPSGIAMVTPEEFGAIPLPQDWGTWDDLVQIWKRDSA